MTENDDLLSFLVEGLIAPQRNLVTRAFYRYAQGDPESYPVNEAVLLTACAHRVGQAPRELKDALIDFRKLLERVRLLEASIQERVETSNASVVASFKDETRRAMNAWRETVEQVNRVGEKAAKMAREMEPAITTVKQIARDLPTVADDLKQHRESAKEISAEVGLVKMIHQENQALMKHFGKEARANWLTVGLGYGMAQAYALDQSQAPPWAQFIFFIVIASMIQGLSRLSWDFMRRWIGKGRTFAC